MLSIAMSRNINPKQVPKSHQIELYMAPTLFVSSLAADMQTFLSALLATRLLLTGMQAPVNELFPKLLFPDAVAVWPTAALEIAGAVADIMFADAIFTLYKESRCSISQTAAPKMGRCIEYRLVLSRTVLFESSWLKCEN
jgi:hypothetical protein